MPLDLGCGWLHSAARNPLAALAEERGALLERGPGAWHKQLGDFRFGLIADDHLHAASGLPLGLADKVFLSIADPEAVPLESHLLGRLDRAATGSPISAPSDGR